jgi:tetratricopeptide (TPR) repeat protein
MRWIRCLALMLLGFMVMPDDLHAQITGAAKGHGRVKGVVSDAEGKPLEEVVVHFSSERLNTNFELRTDKKGEWVAAGIAGGEWNLDFTKEGYIPKSITTSFSIVVFNKPIYITLERSKSTASQSKVNGLDLVQEGNRLKEQKDYSGAIQKYEAAIRENPEWYELYADIGASHLQLKHSDQAEEAYRKLLEKNPEHISGRVALADLLLGQKKVSEAKNVLTPLKLDRLMDPNLAFNLGANFYNAKETKEAIRYFEKAITLDPKMVDAHFQLGVAFLADKQEDNAKREFKKVIDLKPMSEDAKQAKEMMATIQ